MRARAAQRQNVTSRSKSAPHRRKGITSPPRVSRPECVPARYRPDATADLRAGITAKDKLWVSCNLH